MVPLETIYVKSRSVYTQPSTIFAEESKKERYSVNIMMYRIIFLFVCAGFLFGGAVFFSDTVLYNIANARMYTANTLSVLAADTWQDDIAGGECSGSKSDAEDCSNKYITKYVFPGIPAKVVSCKIHPKVVQQYCTGKSSQECKTLINSLVYALTEEEGRVEVDAICEDGSNYGYRGALACFEATVAHFSPVQQAAVLSAVSGGWNCCKEGSTTCTKKLNAIQGIQAASITLDNTKTVSGTVNNSKSSVGGGSVVGADAGFAENDARFSMSNNTVQEGTEAKAFSVSNKTVETVPVSESFSVSNANQAVPNAVVLTASNKPVATWSGGVRTPNTVEIIDINTHNKTTQTTNDKTTQTSSHDLVDAFIGAGGLLDRFTNFVTGSQVPPRATPPGAVGTLPTTQVVYVTPEFETPKVVSESGRSIEDIAREVSATVPQTHTRTEQFAETLSRVGGPNEINTENKAYGRIQDLIIEDEAIRSLEVAEEEAVRAKNSVFCDVAEQSDACQARREGRAREVERQVFIEELTRRELPESAVAHFLAVYDGWIEPSPAPAIYATSTLSLVNAQQVLTKTAATVGAYIQKTVETVTGVVKTVTNSFRGILKEETSFLIKAESMLALTAASQDTETSLRQSAESLFGPSAFYDEVTCAPPQSREIIVRTLGDGFYLQAQFVAVPQGEGISAGCSIDAYGTVRFEWNTSTAGRQTKTCKLFRGPANSGPVETCPTAVISSATPDEAPTLKCWNEIDSICTAYEAGYVDKGELTDKAYADVVAALEEEGFNVRGMSNRGATDKEVYENFIKQGGEQVVGDLDVVFDESSLQIDAEGNPLYVPSAATLGGENVGDIIASEDKSREVLQNIANGKKQIVTGQAPTFPSKNTGYRVDPTFPRYEARDFSRAAAGGDSSYIENAAAGKANSLVAFASESNTVFVSGGATQPEFVQAPDGSWYVQNEPESFVSRVFSGARNTFLNIGSTIGKFFPF